MAVVEQEQLVKKEAHEWIVRLTSGRATVADAEAAKTWCGQSPGHAQALAEATLLWEKLAPVAREMAARAPETRSIPPRVSLNRRAFLGGAIAASAAAVGYLAVRPPLGMWPSVAEIAADYRTGPGEQRRLALDEGIVVEMNTRTSLAVAGARRLELVSGEMAVSSIGAGATSLEVKAGGGRVILADAKADIRCDETTTGVICLQGRVRVEYQAQVTTLEERQQVVFGQERLGPATFADAATATAWREGRLVFHGEPLAKVIGEVNRYRRARIVLMNPALGRRSVEATFALKHTDELVKLVQGAYGAKVTTLPGGIVVLS